MFNLQYSTVQSDGGSGKSQQTATNWTVEGLVSLAESEVGYKEKNSYSLNNLKPLYDKDSNPGNNNYTKYAHDLARAGYYGDSKQGHAWCAVFVEWCFYEYVRRYRYRSTASVDPWKFPVDEQARKTATGLLCRPSDGGGAAVVSNAYNYYKDAGRAGTYPVKGAQIFFTKNGILTHTGIVTGFDNNYVYTVEGNTDKNGYYGTWAKSYDRKDPYIYAYGYPKLGGITVPKSAPTPDPPSAVSSSSNSKNSSNSASSSIYNGMKYSDSNPPLCCMMTNSSCYKRTRKMDIKGILWHSTGANNPWLSRYVQPDDDAEDRQFWLDLLGKNSYRTDLNHSEEQYGLNFWVGKLKDGTVASVQTMPWDYRPWGCGWSGITHCCNDGWIQFEICEDNLKDKEYREAAYKEAVEMTAYLCCKFNIDPNGTVDFHGKQVPTILDHATSWSLGVGGNHGDVAHWFGKDCMKKVREDVTKLIQSGNNHISTVKVGDIVMVETGAISTDGQPAQSYVTNHEWVVSEVISECAKLGRRADTIGVVLNRIFDQKDLSVISSEGSIPEQNRPSNNNNGTVTNEDRIWNLLLLSGVTPEGAAGIMGNMMAESNLNSKNLQQSAESSLGFTDDSYTAAVDSGSYTNFINDGAGYGLVQWTDESLKGPLKEYACNVGKSVGDLDMQVEFLCNQLSETGGEFQSLWKACTDSGRTPADIAVKMLHEFERPDGHDSSGPCPSCGPSNIEYTSWALCKKCHESVRSNFANEFYARHEGACIHEQTTLRDALSATCWSDGYTGDSICMNCGQTVRYGSVVPALEHRYKNGTCEDCGHIYGTDDYNYTSSPVISSCNCEDIVSREDLTEMLRVLKDMLRRGG